MPSKRASSRQAPISSSSVADAASPPLAYTSARMMKSPSAFGTRSPDATVAACSHISDAGACASNAFTIGAHPAACAAIMRGRRLSTSSMASSSSNAFHMPIRPTPPPVG
jgi:hypothetical protein